MELHAIAMQGTNLLWRLAANQVKLDIWQLFSDQRPYAADEPGGGVHVWRMLVATDEKDILSVCPQSAAADYFVDITDDVNPGIGCIPFQHGFFNRAYNQGSVGIPDDGQFRAAGLGCHTF